MEAKLEKFEDLRNSGEYDREELNRWKDAIYGELLSIDIYSKGRALTEHEQFRWDWCMRCSAALDKMYEGVREKENQQIKQATMDKDNKTAIFFDDLTKEAQERIIGEELQTALQMSKEPVIRSFRIDQNLYGYDPDPSKQTLEQHITVLLVDGDRRTTHPWLLVWDCMEAEFATFMQTDQEPPKIEGQLGKAISSRTVGVYLPKENNQ